MAPFDDPAGTWTPEYELKLRAQQAQNMWDIKPSGGKYSWAEGLLSGLGSGLSQNSVYNATRANQDMSNSTARQAAKLPPSQLSSFLLSSGVPGMQQQGLQFAGQQAQFEHQKKLQMQQFAMQRRLQQQLAAEERKSTMDMIQAAMGAAGQGGNAPAQGPAAAAPEATPPGSPAPSAAPSAPENPNAPFADELLQAPTQNRVPDNAAVGLAIALKQPGKALDIMMGKGKPTGDQSRDAMLAERILRSEVDMRGVVPADASGQFMKYDPTAKVNRFLPDWNVTNSPEWQNFNRAAREGIAAILRKDTGAAVTKEEWDWYFPMYYPQPGDSAPVVIDKQRARMALARGLRGSSGPGFDQMFPKFNEQMRARLLQQGADLTPKAPPSGAAQTPSASQYAQVRRNPKTGEMAGYNPQTGAWEVIKSAPAAAPPTMGTMHGTPGIE